MKYKYILTKEFLEREYITNKQSATKIAKELECGTTTIYRYLKKYNILIRDRKESQLGVHFRNRTSFVKGQNAWNKGKNCKKYNWGRKKIFPKNYCDCGKEIELSSKRCWECYLKDIHENPSHHSFYGKRHTEESKEIIRNKLVIRMKEGKYNLSPNKPEKVLNKLLKRILLKEYKFVGDGKFWIDGFNPDFININGQKKIIELYGDYWHNREDSKKRDKKRIKVYKKYGYGTLIIWEHELKDIDKTKQKILEFNRRK